ncbi:hypothetical protein [Shinella sp.]|uniref:hypothetical protein n=1 Tax=Shinella sp. TaxID=1870904 RepID=UPI0028AD5464|nr:hypothetical protein [Shinella sp.]
MKKITIDQIRFRAIIAKDRARRRAAWILWRRLKRIGKATPQASVLQDGKRFRSNGYKAVPLPAVFCLDENPEETLRAIQEINEKVISNSMQVKADAAAGRRKRTESRTYFDFKTVDFMGASAALILASIYQTGKSITGRRLRTIDEHRWKPGVVWLLRQLGFHELLEMQPYSRQHRYTGDFAIQPFLSGQRAVGEELGKLQDALALLLPDELREKLLTAEPYGGMLEAILNSYSWAYPKGHEWGYDVLANWWLTGAVDKETNSVVVCAYDRGVSIPFSLPHWEHWGMLQSYAQKILRRLKLSSSLDHSTNDGVALRLAMKIAKTATQLPQHGKGLHTMVEVAERARYGRLRILSRYGEYVWETGKRPRSFNHQYPLLGTLVEWHLEL